MLAVVGLYIHIFRVRESERCEGESDIIGRQHVHGKCVCVGVRPKESGWCKGEGDLIAPQSKRADGVRVRAI